MEIERGREREGERVVPGLPHLLRCAALRSTMRHSAAAPTGALVVVVLAAGGGSLPLLGPAMRQEAQ